MSIFKTIAQAVFGATSPEQAPAPIPAAGDPPRQASPASTPMTRIPRHQVERQIEALAEARRQDSTWETSIVDLLELLDVDSSYENRRELAKELGYVGHYQGTGPDNDWLHDAVLNKLAETGGKVPDHFND